MIDQIWRKLVAAVVILALGGCDLTSIDDGYESWCNCSIMQLVVDPDKYHDIEVRVQGTVIPMEHSSGNFLLYFSKEDAQYIRDSNAVIVDLTDQLDVASEVASRLFGKVVTVRGVFRRNGRALVIDNVSDLRPLTPLPLDATRHNPVVEPIER